MPAAVSAAGTGLTAQAALRALQTDGSDDTIALLIFFGVGLYLAYNGFQKWQRKRLMQDTPTEKVRSAAAGRTELTGTCEPIDGVGTIDQPFSDGDCVVATYKIAEWDDTGDDSHWETLDSGTLLVPFHLDDGTGRMRVEPEPDATYEISSANTEQIRVSDGQTPPDAIAEFLKADRNENDSLFGDLLDGGPSVRGSDDRRYTQSVLPPGANVYLLGGAEPGDDGQLVLGRDEASEEFVIADQPEEEVVSEYSWEAPAQIAGGIALSAGMLYLLLV